MCLVFNEQEFRPPTRLTLWMLLLELQGTKKIVTFPPGHECLRQPATPSVLPTGRGGWKGGGNRDSND